MCRSISRLCLTIRLLCSETSGKDGGAPRQPIAIAVHCPHTCRATRSSSTSRASNAPACGGALHVIGEDQSEMLDRVPAQLRVKVVCRPRYGCRTCEGAVVQA